jgi:chemotaxis protein histidine kinase CheA
MFAVAKQGGNAPAQVQDHTAPGQAKKQQAAADAPTAQPAPAPQQQALPVDKHAAKQQAKAERQAAQAAATATAPTNGRTKDTAQNTATTQQQTSTKAASKAANKAASAQAQSQASSSLPPGQAKKEPAATAATAPAPAPVATPAAPATPTTTVAKPKARTKKTRKHQRAAASTPRRTIARSGPTVAALASIPVASSTAAATKKTEATKTDATGFVPTPEPSHDDTPNVVFRTVRDAVEVVPTTIWILLGLLTALTSLFAVTSARQTRRARRFAAEAGTLMGDVGVLQEAVLPIVPPRVGALALSVAHRPAGGPAAGGDFYDVVPLDGDRTALVVGDVTGHGPGALGQATLVRFTLRAHLESGAGPREALAIATESLAPHFEEGFATAAVAIHDPKAGTLTYATAAHEAPIVVGPGSHDPVLVASTPPLGIGAGGPSARRQTVVPFPEQSLACMLTDGALEARVRGELVGRARVEQWVRELGERPAAGDMAELIRSRAKVSDDLAVCFATSTAGQDSGNWRVEELHRPTPDEAERFLTACGAGDEHKRAAVEALRFSREGTVLTVRFEKDVVVSATVQRNGNPAVVAA